MCGRYSLVCIDDLGNRFRVHNPMIGSRSRFNIVPGNEMPVIVRKDKDAIAVMRWGLPPLRTKALATTMNPINARAESLAENAIFAPLLEHGRCLVPASGFYEWKNEGTRKVPFYFSMPENPIFAFAGLYETRENASGIPSASYAIITCAPNGLVARVHNRMPAILSRENEECWLSTGPLSSRNLAGILTPSIASSLAMTPVASLVNNPALDDERLIRPLVGLSG
jgi:putative SOS response-associated peptidase YedK